MRFYIICISLYLASTPLFAQNSITGIIKDSSGNFLEGANVQLYPLGKGTSSNKDGEFELSGIDPGEYMLRVSYLGFQTYEKRLIVNADMNLQINMQEDPYIIEGVVVEATRVKENSPSAFTTISNQELDQKNLGQDFPYLIESTPGVVAFSDAGTGVGYSGLRIRGSDPGRVNVTINGVPLNDSESQAVYWVDIPDFASSVQTVQVQRGVGTSTNGSGAFGASINMETGISPSYPNVSISSSYGSFNTRKNSLAIGTGLIKNKLSFNVRLSEIASDGYIDRASTSLRSFFIDGSYKGRRSLMKLIIFSGKEVTYQAWDGVSESDLELNRTFNVSGQIGPNSFYENQVDDYLQNHYQLHYNYFASSEIEFGVSLHYTKGFGFFEQYRVDDVFADYGLPDITIGAQTISTTDLVRRRWLDNDFYGTTFSFIYSPNPKMKFTGGGSVNQYKGDHFGEIIWARFSSSNNTDRYYDNTGTKTESNFYLKPELSITSKLLLFGDFQYRNVDYQVTGVDSDQRALSTDKTFNFLNPKIGLSYQFNSSTLVYLNYSHGNREPDRNDFIDSQDGSGPKHESLNDFEAGVRFKSRSFGTELNLYSMQYNNQLVLTGELNDVGSPIRRNVDKSHRTGAELSVTWNIRNNLKFSGNLAYSINKIHGFSETAPIFDFSFNYLRDSTIAYKDTNIILSPEVVSYAQISYSPLKGLNLSFDGKYVSDQFLDNKSNDDRKLDAFLVNDFNIVYNREFNNASLKGIALKLQVNNLFDVRYEPNGYSYFILFDDGSTVSHDNYNYYYPQAGINFLAGVSLSF